MSPHQDIAELEDWVAETSASISTRLEGAKAAQSQIRWTLGTMAVISVMMLIVSHNAYLSYDYYWITEASCKKSPAPNESPTPQVSASKVSDTLREQAYRDWASSRTVLISLLGIRVSVDDAAVLGTSVLLVLSLWLLLVARRENHTIGFLLRDTDTPRPAGNPESPAESGPKVYSDSERWLIYHTIISNSLFVIFDHFPNVRTLAGPNSLTATARREGDGRLGGVGLRLARNFFFWFPMLASLSVFGLDWWSYRRWDPFTPGCKPDDYTLFFWITRVVFVVCWVPLMMCCVKSNRYSKDTERVLRKYGRRLSADLKRKQSTKS